MRNILLLIIYITLSAAFSFAGDIPSGKRVQFGNVDLTIKDDNFVKGKYAGGAEGTARFLINPITQEYYFSDNTFETAFLQSNSEVVESASWSFKEGFQYGIRLKDTMSEVLESPKALYGATPSHVVLFKMTLDYESVIPTVSMMDGRDYIFNDANVGDSMVFDRVLIIGKFKFPELYCEDIRKTRYYVGAWHVEKTGESQLTIKAMLEFEQAWGSIYLDPYFPIQHFAINQVSRFQEGKDGYTGADDYGITDNNTDRHSGGSSAAGVANGVSQRNIGGATIVRILKYNVSGTLSDGTAASASLTFNIDFLNGTTPTIEAFVLKDDSAAGVDTGSESDPPSTTSGAGTWVDQKFQNIDEWANGTGFSIDDYVHGTPIGSLAVTSTGTKVISLSNARISNGTLAIILIPQSGGYFRAGTNEEGDAPILEVTGTPTGISRYQFSNGYINSTSLVVPASSTTSGGGSVSFTAIHNSESVHLASKSQTVLDDFVTFEFDLSSNGLDGEQFVVSAQSGESFTRVTDELKLLDVFRVGGGGSTDLTGIAGRLDYVASKVTTANPTQAVSTGTEISGRIASTSSTINTINSNLLQVRQISKIAANIVDPSASIVSDIAWSRIGEITPVLEVKAISSSSSKPNLSIQVTKKDSAAGAPIILYTQNMQTTSDAFSYRVDPATPNIGGVSEASTVQLWEHQFSLQLDNDDYREDFLTASVFLNDGTFTYARHQSISGNDVVVSTSGFATAAQVLGASEFVQFVAERLTAGGLIDSMTACYVSSATLERATAGEYSSRSRFAPPSSLYAISYTFISGNTETHYWDYDESPGTRQRIYFATREDYLDIDPEAQATLEGVTLTIASITAGGGS